MPQRLNYWSSEYGDNATKTVSNWNKDIKCSNFKVIEKEDGDRSGYAVICKTCRDHYAQYGGDFNKIPNVSRLREDQRGFIETGAFTRKKSKAENHVNSDIHQRLIDAAEAKKKGQGRFHHLFLCLFPYSFLLLNLSVTDVLLTWY